MMTVLRRVRRLVWAVPVAMLGAASARAQIVAQPAPVPTSSLMLTVAKCTVNPKIEAQALWVSPRPAFNPVEGQLVQLDFDIKNVCNGPLNIPWEIRRFNELVGSGVAQNVPAGQVVGVRAMWTGVAGTHNFFAYADPNNTVGDVAPYKHNVYSLGYVVNVAPNWPAWATGAKTGAQNGINAAIAQATVKGSILGAYGKISAGGVDGAVGYIMGPVYTAMGTAPDGVKSAVVGALKDAWGQWALGYELTALGQLNWPTFALYPTQEAPLTPPTPTTAQIKAGSSSGAGAMSAASLAANIKSRLPAYEAGLSGADAAINDIAQSIADRFTMWRGSTGNVCSIWGSGKNPSWSSMTPVPGPIAGTLQAKLCGSF